MALWIRLVVATLGKPNGVLMDQMLLEKNANCQCVNRALDLDDSLLLDLRYWR